MTVALDDLGGAYATTAPAPERLPGQFARHPGSGAPYVLSLTETTKRQGNKAELLAQAAAEGVEVPDKITVAELHALLGPAGPRKVLYGRPSSLGKQIENAIQLQKWSERVTALGMATAPELVDEARALLGLDPESREFKAKADELAGRAKRAAGAMLAAERGTHHHELTEDHDNERDPIARMAAGEELGVPRPVQEALLAAWAKMLAEAGLEILATEAPVVDDEWRQAGTLDRIARLTRPLRVTTVTGEVLELPAGLVIVLDIKTGRLRRDRAGFVAYWHGYAVQVASYAKAVPYNPDTDQRGAWPFEVDQKWALIAHLDVLGALNEAKAVCRLIPVDLEAGRHAGDLAVKAREWQHRTDVFGLVDDELAYTVPVATPPAEELEGAFDGLPTTDTPDPLAKAVTDALKRTIAPYGPEDRIRIATTEAEARGGAPDPSTTPADAARRAWVLARLAALKADPAAEATMRALWPAGVPGVLGDHLHTVAELDRIIDALDETDRRHEGALTADPLHRDRTYRIPDPPPEGFTLGKAQVADLVDAVEALPDSWRDLLVDWAAEAHAAGVSWSLAERKSSRRAAVYRAALALIRLVEGDPAEVDLARATIRTVAEGALAEGFTLGAPIGVALARLTAEQARRVKELAAGVADGQGVLMYDDDGAPRWAEVIPAPAPLGRGCHNVDLPSGGTAIVCVR